MKERPTNGQVIIVFTEHPILGILLIPYIAEKLDDGTLQLVEQAFHASPEAMSKMSEAERQAISYRLLLYREASNECLLPRKNSIAFFT